MDAEPPAGMPPDGTLSVAECRSPSSPPTLLPVWPATVVMPQPFCSPIVADVVVAKSNEIVAPAGIATEDLLANVTRGLIG
ncbi:hypothetical protein D3C74_490910 [compost metagenome]